MSLTNEQINRIESLLFSDSIAEDAVDYFGLHGLVCASLVGPTTFTPEQLGSLACGQVQPALAEKDIKELVSLIDILAQDINNALLQGDTVNPPYMEEEDEDYEDGLISWCEGFMEAFITHEQNWFEKSQEQAAELLLPVMVLSQLFEDEEMEKIRHNQKVMDQFEEQIPDLITDLFLYYHTEK